MKRILRYFALLLLVVSFVGTFYYLYQKSQKPPEHFQTQTPITTNIVKKTVATGSIVPRKEIEIKPQVKGIIDEIFVEPGTTVEKDAPIARVKIIPDMVTLNNAESRVNQAQIGFADAEKTYQRKSELHSNSLISEELFQQTELAYQQAKAELESAESNLQLIKEGVTKKSEAPTNTVIRSTIAGMILDVPVKQGFSVIESNSFNEGSTIATIADMREMIFEGEIDESEIGKIKEGMALILTVGAIENETFDASIEYISPKGVLNDGTVRFSIKARIALKPSHFLRAGYSANADIVLDQKTQVLAINESLLQFENDLPFVEVEKQPQQFEKRMIEVGLSDGIHIEVLKGLSATDQIKVLN